jgi:hypothetical protein
MARPIPRPKLVKVLYRGTPYWLNLERCRQALVDCQIDGELSSIGELSCRCKISRSTASRFFAGQPTSLRLTLKILSALRLTFPDVAEAASEDEGNEEDNSDGAGAGARLPQRPDAPGRGAERDLEWAI